MANITGISSSQNLTDGDDRALTTRGDYMTTVGVLEFKDRGHNGKFDSFKEFKLHSTSGKLKNEVAIRYGLRELGIDELKPGTNWNDITEYVEVYSKLVDRYGPQARYYDMQERFAVSRKPGYWVHSFSPNNAPIETIVQEVFLSWQSAYENLGAVAARTGISPTWDLQKRYEDACAFTQSCFKIIFERALFQAVQKEGLSPGPVLETRLTRLQNLAATFASLEEASQGRIFANLPALEVQIREASRSMLNETVSKFAESVSTPEGELNVNESLKVIVKFAEHLENPRERQDVTLRFLRACEELCLQKIDEQIRSDYPRISVLSQAFQNLSLASSEIKALAAEPKIADVTAFRIHTYAQGFERVVGYLENPELSDYVDAADLKTAEDFAIAGMVPGWQRKLASLYTKSVQSLWTRSAQYYANFVASGDTYDLANARRELNDAVTICTKAKIAPPQPLKILDTKITAAEAANGMRL